MDRQPPRRYRGRLSCPARDSPAGGMLPALSVQLV